MKQDRLFIEEDTTSLELLKKVLKEYNINNYELIKNEYGKLYLKNNDIYFNISNKDNVTVIYVSNYECGVDIEKITFNDKVMNKYYNDLEKEIVNKSLNKEEAFTEIWVKKEAYIKMLGIGLSYGIDKVDTNKYQCNVKKYKDYFIAYCRNDKNVIL